ncbi:MAG: hypothetical protein NT009_04590 [Proteobacteria bacterium]|nr:hypothetical protein [Pseudomonadota bacterium]
MFDQLAVEVFPEGGGAGVVDFFFGWDRSRGRGGGGFGLDFLRAGPVDFQDFQDPRADLDFTAGLDLGIRLNFPFIDERSVGGAQVLDPGLAVPAEELGVLAGDPGFGDDQGAVRAPPDQDLFPGQFPSFGGCPRGAGPIPPSDGTRKSGNYIIFKDSDWNFPFF